MGKNKKLQCRFPHPFSCFSQFVGIPQVWDIHRHRFCFHFSTIRKIQMPTSSHFICMRMRAHQLKVRLFTDHVFLCCIAGYINLSVVWNLKFWKLEISWFHFVEHWKFPFPWITPHHIAQYNNFWCRYCL